MDAFCRFGCPCRNSFCTFSSRRTGFSPTFLWCLCCSVQWCTETVCFLFSLASYPYLSFVGTFETVLQGAPSYSTGVIRLPLSSLKTTAFFQYSTLTRRGQGRRFVVYMTRGHFRIGRCVGVCQWEFLIIDVRNELILEF